MRLRLRRNIFWKVANLLRSQQFSTCQAATRNRNITMRITLFSRINSVVKWLNHNRGTTNSRGTSYITGAYACFFFMRHIGCKNVLHFSVFSCFCNIYTELLWKYSYYLGTLSTLLLLENGIHFIDQAIFTNETFFSVSWYLILF